MLRSFQLTKRANFLASPLEVDKCVEEARHSKSSSPFVGWLQKHWLCKASSLLAIISQAERIGQELELHQNHGQMLFENPGKTSFEASRPCSNLFADLMACAERSGASA